MKSERFSYSNTREAKVLITWGTCLSTLPGPGWYRVPTGRSKKPDLQMPQPALEASVENKRKTSSWAVRFSERVSSQVYIGCPCTLSSCVWEAVSGRTQRGGSFPLSCHLRCSPTTSLGSTPCPSLDPSWRECRYRLYLLLVTLNES